MAKKDNDNFDFETESEGKGKFDLAGFFKNLTKKQRGIILAAVVGVILVVAIVITCIALTTSNGNTNENGNNITPGVNGSEDNNSNEEENGVTVPEQITEFYISSIPNKKVYYVGDSADYSGLTVQVRGVDGVSRTINYSDDMNSFVITGFDSSSPANNQTITVECRGYTDTFSITIKEVPLVKPTLVSIRLDPAPRDTAKAGVALSVKDAKIVCVYSDGSEKSVKLAHSHLYGYENELMNAEVGDVITVYVRYTEDGYVAETSYTVTVIE